MRLLALVPDTRPTGGEATVHIEDRVVEVEGRGGAGHVRVGSTILS